MDELDYGLEYIQESSLLYCGSDEDKGASVKIERRVIRDMFKTLGSSNALKLSKLY
jgi:hypothetical protein